MHASPLGDLINAIRLHAILFAILLSYLAAVMYIGFKSTKKQNSLEDFFLAGRTVPW